LLLSLIGLAIDRPKKLALLGVLVSGAMIALFCLLTLCR
jgi:hypothetical protein